MRMAFEKQKNAKNSMARIPTISMIGNDGFIESHHHVS